jgi:hypothetical protein
MPDHDVDPEKSKGTEEPDSRRLLDGYAEPGRVRRLRDRHSAGRLAGFAGRGRWLVLRARSGRGQRG